MSCCSFRPRLAPSEQPVVEAYNVLLRTARAACRRRMSPTCARGCSRVTADAAAAKLFGLEPAAVDYIRIAGEMGVSRKDLANLAIRRIAL